MDRLELPRLVRPPQDHRHAEDVSRLVRAALAGGYEISATDAAWAWELYSEEQWAAGWIGLPPDDADVVDILVFYCKTEWP